MTCFSSVSTSAFRAVEVYDTIGPPSCFPTMSVPSSQFSCSNGGCAAVPPVDNRRRGHAWLVVALLCVVTAARADAQQLTLVVTANGRPLAGAVVIAGGFMVRTDTTGTAVVPEGMVGVEATVAAEGFLPITLQLVPSRSGTIEVALEPIAEFAERVVVSASRSPTRLEDQPLRVEVIDEEEIEEKALMTPGSVAMLIGETTGLRVQATAPSLGASNVRIQGLRGRYSQMLADGLPLYGGQGDSFSMLQVPPLDLGRVDIIKGAASALYGASALGGVINLVSRRPAEAVREVLLNATSLVGSDASVWLADVPSEHWRWTFIGTYNRQGRRDRDGDGWTDVAGYERGGARPRLFFDNGSGTTLLATGGVMIEAREGGTLDGRVAPDGRPFTESLRTARGDVGAVASWLTASSRVLHVRGSYGRRASERLFGEVRERGVRDTAFGEVSLQGVSGGHTWVLGGAFQRDAFRTQDVPALDYAFDVPAVFAQDEVSVGPVRLAFSGRVDVHDAYGVHASPRASVLWRPAPPWSVRFSAGGGSFGPTPFVEATDETGLSRLDPLAGLAPERAWSGSFDVTRRVGGLELSGTWFTSVVRNPVQMVSSGAGRSRLLNAAGPTRTWGRSRRRSRMPTRNRVSSTSRLACAARCR